MALTIVCFGGILVAVSRFGSFAPRFHVIVGCPKVRRSFAVKVSMAILCSSWPLRFAMMMTGAVSGRLSDRKSTRIGRSINSPGATVAGAMGKKTVVVPNAACERVIFSADLLAMWMATQDSLQTVRWQI